MDSRPLSALASAMLGESEMAGRVRAFDWAATPLGPMARWPQSLRIAVGICLNSRFPMFVWWGEQLINIYNDGYIPMLGARHPGGLGRPARESWNDIWADVGPQAELVMKHGQATWNERVHLRMERHGYPEDTWFTWSYSPIRDESGAVGGLFCAVTEDTPRVLAERQRDRLAGNLAASESRFRALVSASSDVVYRMNRDWTEMRQLDGRDFIEDTSGPSADWLEKYILAEDRARVREAVERAIATRGMFQLEHRVRRVDGSVGWTLSRAVPILDERGEVLEWFGAASDVTARKEADRRKDEFLAMLAHELRNPLAPLSNALHALRLSRDAATAGAAQDVMDRQIRQLVRLVNELLDVSRIAGGKVALKKAPVTLAEVLDDAIETAQPLFDERRQSLSREVPRAIWLDADHARLAQVFANILHNAAKFTPPGGHIGLATRTTPRGVTVEVRDDGIGIPADKLASVFELFAQADNSIERPHSGLGLGLTIVRTLVEMHGGTVDAASDGPGLGATFTVRLPTREAPVAAPAARRGAASEGGTALRLLVVDDNRDSAQSLGRLLELLGHEVRLQYDGPSAVTAASEFSPDAVFLDIGMPGMSGFEVCRRLRARPGADGMVLIAQTGWGDAAQRARSSEAGFDHHLVKPLDFAMLKDLLAAVSRRPA